MSSKVVTEQLNLGLFGGKNFENEHTWSRVQGLKMCLVYPANRGKHLLAVLQYYLLLRLCYYSLLFKMRLAETSKAFPEELLWWEVTGVLSCCKLSVPSFVSLIFVQSPVWLISTDKQTILHGFPAKYVDLGYWWNSDVIDQAHSVDLKGTV